MSQSVLDQVPVLSMAEMSKGDFAAAFGPGSQAEVAFQAALPQFGETAQVSGRIDRLAVTPDEVLILDYKTNRPPPRDPAHVDPAYVFQMAAYRGALRAIYPDRAVYCALLWTDGPFIMELSGEQIDDALSRVSLT